MLRVWEINGGLQFRILHLDKATFAENWLQLGELDNEFVARQYSFFRVDRKDERIGCEH